MTPIPVEISAPEKQFMLFFDNVEVPAENLLGQENNGFIYLMQELPWERMQIAIGAAAKCEAALRWTIDFVNERKAFGKPVASFQNTRFKLAEVATKVQIMRVFVDRCMASATVHCCEQLLLSPALRIGRSTPGNVRGDVPSNRASRPRPSLRNAARSNGFIDDPGLCGSSAQSRPAWSSPLGPLTIGSPPS